MLIRGVDFSRHHVILASESESPVPNTPQAQTPRGEMVARVLAVTGSEAVLEAGGQRVVVETHVPLQTGDKLYVKVHEGQDGSLRMQILASESDDGVLQGLAEAEVDTLLDELGVPVNERSRAVARALLARDGNVDKAALQKLLADLRSFPQVTPREAGAAALLHKAGMPVTYQTVALVAERAVPGAPPQLVARLTALPPALDQARKHLPAKSQGLVDELLGALTGLPLDEDTTAPRVAEALKQWVARLQPQEASPQGPVPLAPASPATARPEGRSPLDETGEAPQAEAHAAAGAREAAPAAGTKAPQPPALSAPDGEIAPAPPGRPVARPEGDRAAPVEGGEPPPSPKTPAPGGQPAAAPRVETAPRTDVAAQAPAVPADQDPAAAPDGRPLALPADARGQAKLLPSEKTLLAAATPLPEGAPAEAAARQAPEAARKAAPIAAQAHEQAIVAREAAEKAGITSKVPLEPGRDLATLLERLEATLPDAQKGLRKLIHEAIAEMRYTQLVNGPAPDAKPTGQELLVPLMTPQLSQARPEGRIQVFHKPAQPGAPVDPQNVRLVFVVETANMGTVQTDVTIKQGVIDLVMGLSDPDDCRFMTEHLDELEAAIAALGWETQRFAARLAKAPPPKTRQEEGLSELVRFDRRV